MKRLIAILTFVIITTGTLPGAFAASIAEQIAAPARISETVQSDSGNWNITFEADLIVPEAESVSIYAVSPRAFTPEEIERIAAAVFDIPYEGTPEYQPSSLTLENGETVIQPQAAYHSLEQGEGRNNKLVPLSRMLVTTHEKSDGTLLLSEIDYQRRNEALRDPDIVRFSAEHAPPALPTDTKPVNCNISFEDAKAQADAIAAKAAPHMAYTGHGTIQWWNPNPPADPDAVITVFNAEAWIFYYAPVYDIPCSLAYDSFMLNTSGNIGAACTEESLRIVINHEGVQNLNYSSPHTLTSVIEEDCQLLSFNQVMDVARSILPLTANTADSREGTHAQINIDEIRLGCMRIVQNDQPENMILVPVWDFYGTIEVHMDDFLAWRTNTAMDSLLTINAIDGTVIDRKYGF